MRPQPIITLVASATQAFAVCTQWEHERNSQTDAQQYNTYGSIAIERLACPAEGPGCRFPGPNMYNVTVRPFILFSARMVDGGGSEANELPRDEADAIYRLAEKGFNDQQEDFANRSTSLKKPVHREFVPLSATVNNTKINDDWFEVKAGQNSTLRWIPFHVYSHGTLHRCTNATLENRTVLVAAGYWALGQNSTQTRFVAGLWSKSTEKPDDEKDDTTDGDPDSGAATLDTGLFSWVTVASSVLAISLAL